MTSGLVTGATGFIGRHLCERLLADGWTVKAVVRDPAKWLDKPVGLSEIIPLDLATSGLSPDHLAGVEVVFHCAANVNTWDTQDAYHAINVAALRPLLEAMAAQTPPPRLVHLSSVDVYGFPLTPCDETAPIGDTGFGYGDSKAAGERVVRQEGERLGIAYTILRPGNVIGPGSQFIARMGAELRGGLMLLVDGGSANGGFVAVDTLVGYMVWAARAHIATGQVYNVRDHYDVTWREFVYALRDGITGRGWVVSLPFGVAEAVAMLLTLVWRFAWPGREPLLHRLLIRLFGRTCGHSAEKIRRHSGIAGERHFATVMAAAVAWFNRRARGLNSPS